VKFIGKKRKTTNANSLAGLEICFADAEEESGVHGSGDSYAGAGNWREHRDL
jgi:hypothetical protein